MLYKELNRTWQQLGGKSPSFLAKAGEWLDNIGLSKQLGKD
jgi:hypothetical protein